MLARLTLLPFAALLVAHAPSVGAQSLVASELAKLVASDGGTSEFGASVALSGDTAVVGAPWDAHGQENSGAAYVLQRDYGGPGAWGEVRKLVPSDPAEDQYFGWSVALSGDTALVGAYGDDSAGWSTGAAYVFERDQGGPDAWGQVAKLTASDAESMASFGMSVALSGNTALVGAPWTTPYPTANYHEGEVYRFERHQGGGNAWGEAGKLTASDPGSSNHFGWSVAIEGGTAVVGAPWFHDLTPYADSAYVFERNQGGAGAWGLTRQLVGTLWPHDDPEFGSSVGLSGDTVVVGAPNDAQSWLFNNPGSAFVFERDEGGPGAWGEVVRLAPGDPLDYGGFGSSIDVSGDTAVVGSVGWDGPGSYLAAIEGLAFDPGANVLYGAAWELLTIDPSTGLGTPVGILGFSDVRALAFDPGTSTLYGADTASDHLIGIDTATGAGTSIGPLGFKRVWGLAFDPGTSTLYGADGLTDQLLVIDTATGAGTAVGPFGLSTVRGLAFDPGTGTLYGVTVGTDQLLVIDPATGAATAVGFLGFSFELVEGLAFDSVANALKGADNYTGELILVDTATGAGSSIGGISAAYNAGAAYVFERDQGGLGYWGEAARISASDGKANDQFGVSAALSGDTALVGAWRVGSPGLSLGDVGSLALHPATGTLYATESFGDQLLTIDALIGEATPVGVLGFDDVRGLAFDPATAALYGADASSDQLIAIDPATGAGTAIGSFGFTSADQDVEALAFDPTTGILYAARSPMPNSLQKHKLFAIDTATGAGSFVGKIGFTISGLAFDASTSTLHGAGGHPGDLITIDTATGAGTLVGSSSFSSIAGLAFDSGANVLYGAEPDFDQLILLDTATGAGSAIGSFSKLAWGSGAAYVYELFHDSIAYCVSGTSASGCQARLSALGFASATAPAGFDLVASNVEGAKDGMFFYGTNGRQAKPWGNGTSYVCVVPPVRRGGLLAGAGTPGGCNGVFVQDLNARWCPTCPKPAHNPGPGALVQAQLWYRDPLSTESQPTSFSDALEFLVGP